MSNYCFNDYDKFIGKYITVIYECGSKCKELHCKLLRYCEKSSKEKLIILKAHNKAIYHINCDKIIYWMAEYEDMLAENQDTYKSNTKCIKSNAITESEDLLSEKIQDKETISIETSNPNNQLQDVELLQGEKIINSCSTNPPEEDTSLIPNQDTNCDYFQENNVMLLESKNIIDTSVEPVSNGAIISEVHDIKETIPFETNLISDQSTTCNEVQESNVILEKHNHNDIYKKNVLRSPLAAFINCNFQGVYLTIYTTYTQAISGEVIFNYDHLIALKSDGKTYYINPEQITYFC